MKSIRLLLLCIVSVQAQEPFTIRRESGIQRSERVNRALARPNLQGQPIGVAIPPSSIKEVFIPFSSINPSDMELSDDAVRALFRQCTFISDNELHRNHLAPWKTLVITTVSNETIPMHLFLGATLGTVTFDIAGEVAFKCVR